MYIRLTTILFIDDSSPFVKHGNLKNLLEMRFIPRGGKPIDRRGDPPGRLEFKNRLAPRSTRVAAQVLHPGCAVADTEQLAIMSSLVEEKYRGIAVPRWEMDRNVFTSGESRAKHRSPGLKVSRSPYLPSLPNRINISGDTIPTYNETTSSTGSAGQILFTLVYRPKSKLWMNSMK